MEKPAFSGFVKVWSELSLRGQGNVIMPLVVLYLCWEQMKRWKFAS